MSPLRRRHKEHDIYSFGVLLFEIGLWDIVDPYFKSLDERVILARSKRGC